MADGAQVAGTVKTASPLMIWTDGADTAVPADTLTTGLTANQPIQVTIRGFSRPLVQGAVQ